MSRLDSFSPDSPFGVPLVPFPPGVTWTNTLEMIQEAFQDMRLMWVRKYLLRPSNVDDICGLINSENYNKAFSLVYNGKTIPHLSGGFKSKMLNVRLNLPIKRIGDVAVGIGVESANVEDSGHVVFSKSDLFFRFATNTSNNCHLNIRIYKDRNTIEATYTVYVGQIWQYAILVFNHDVFLEAFSMDIHNYAPAKDACGSEAFDAEKLNTGLIQSIVGGVNHERRLNLEYLRSMGNMGNKAYPYVINENIGTHFFKNVICSYAGGIPMMSIPAFAHASWTYEYDATALRRMQNWGISERLQRLKIRPMRQPSSLQQHRSHHRDLLDFAASTNKSIGLSSMWNSPALTSQNMNVNFRSSTNTNDVEIESLRTAKEDVRKAKKERRIIKNREATARSNARKAAERRKLREQMA